MHSLVNLSLFLLLGDPTPTVTWWRDSHLVDSSFEGTYKQTMQNTLSIPNINKQDLLAELTCSASNNNITMPSKTSVVIEMKCMYQYERKLAMNIVLYQILLVRLIKMCNFSSTRKCCHHKQT